MDYESIKNLKWPEDKGRVKEVQEILRRKLRVCPLPKKPGYVAGVDASFFGDKIIAAACLYKYPELILVEEVHIVKEVTFPYIPGLLSFREGPAIIEAIEKLKTSPDVIIFDGQGIAHPKGLGIASHVGVLLDISTIGCAKSRLVGTYIEPGVKKGSWSPLKHGGKVVGAVLRTQDNTRPLFVSSGHRADLKGSIGLIMGCTGKFRLTEPVRRADMLSRKLKKHYCTIHR